RQSGDERRKDLENLMARPPVCGLTMPSVALGVPRTLICRGAGNATLVLPLSQTANAYIQNVPYISRSGLPDTLGRSETKRAKIERLPNISKEKIMATSKQPPEKSVEEIVTLLQQR